MASSNPIVDELISLLSPSSPFVQLPVHNINSTQAWTRGRGGRSTRPQWDSRRPSTLSRLTLNISWTSLTWSEVTTWRRCSGSPMEKAIALEPIDFEHFLDE